MSESAEEAKRPPADKTGNWVESLAGLLIWVVIGIVARIFEVRPPAVSVDQATHAFGIREELIRNYMYLLSAPFLAIAIYYLLQIIATQVSQPVLVVMAFVTGLASELIVASILAFADRTLEALPKKKPAQVVDISGTQLEAIAASREETGATRPLPEPPRGVAFYHVLGYTA